MLNGRFFHGSIEVGRIVNNEWQGLIDHVDIETISNRITISQKRRKIFELELFPPNKIVVNEMVINIDNNLAIVNKRPNGKRWFLLIGDARIETVSKHVYKV